MNVRVDCPSCGFHLAKLHREASGQLVNVDKRPVGHIPRLAYDREWNRWRARCKCGFDGQIQDEKLDVAFGAVSNAGLGRMPFKTLP